MHTYIHTYILYACAWIHTCMHKYIHIQKYTYIHAYIHVHTLTVADPGVASPAMAPIEVGHGVWPPFGGRRINDSIVNLSKCKKGPQKFWEIDDILGKC